MIKLLMGLNAFNRLMDEAGAEGGGGGEVTNALAEAATKSSESTETTESSNPPEGGEGEETADDIEKAIIDGEGEFKGKWDLEQIKGIAPMLKECGVTKENATKLANKLAEIQTRQMQAYEQKMRQEQIERIRKQDAENAKEFSKADYEQICLGLNKFVKQSGPLYTLLTTTELGTDPEVLRILHTLGGLGGTAEKSAPVATGAAGNSNGWAASFEK